MLSNRLHEVLGERVRHGDRQVVLGDPPPAVDHAKHPRTTTGAVVLVCQQLVEARMLAAWRKRDVALGALVCLLYTSDAADDRYKV